MKNTHIKTLKDFDRQYCTNIHNYVKYMWLSLSCLHLQVSLNSLLYDTDICK